MPKNIILDAASIK